MLKIPVTRRGAHHLERDALLCRLDHPNIVRGFAADLAGPRPYVAMDYMPGQTLSQHTALPLAEVIDIMRQLAMSLMHLEQRGVVHLDLHPRNVVVAPPALARHGCVARHATLIDFGHAVASPMQDGRPVGHATTLPIHAFAFGLLAPELLGSPASTPIEVDIRTDIYAWGVMLTMLGSGQNFCDAVALQRGAAQLPAKVRAVIERCCQPLPDERFPDATALLRAVESLAAVFPMPLAGSTSLPETSPAEPRLAETSGKRCPLCLSSNHTRGTTDGDYCRWCEYTFDLFKHTETLSVAIRRPTDESAASPSRLTGLHLASEFRHLLTGEGPSATETMAMSPDARIVAGIRENVIRFWEVAGGRKLYEIASENHSLPGKNRVLAFSPDGLRLALGHRESVSLWGWDTTQARSAKAPRLVWSQNLRGMVGTITFSPDGALLAVRAGRGVAVCAASSGEKTDVVRRFQVCEQWFCHKGFIARLFASLFYSKEGREIYGERWAYYPGSVAWLDPLTLLGTHPEGGLIAWRLAEAAREEQTRPGWTESRRWSSPCAAGIRLARSRAGDRIATLECPTLRCWNSGHVEGGALALWNVRQDDPPIIVMTGISDEIMDLAFSHDDRFLVIAVSGPRFRVYDVESLAGPNPVSAFWEGQGGGIGEGVQADLLGPLRIGGDGTGLWLALTDHSIPLLCPVDAHSSRAGRSECSRS